MQHGPPKFDPDAAKAGTWTAVGVLTIVGLIIL